MTYVETVVQAQTGHNCRLMVELMYALTMEECL